MLNIMSKEQWGKACWYMFHTIAHKLKPERTDLVEPLLNNIMNICSNLPCQECSSHASSILSSLNKNTIRTPRDLAKMLWMFHNNINNRLKLQQITIEEHDELYSRAKLVQVVNHFNMVMNQRMGNERAIMYSMSRYAAVASIFKFVRENANAFVN